ncbi:MAG: protoporphyrinogen oxidase [Planctomycetota bacterium]|jgi:oxygen-dependent protoporphyrinogen oxidase
MRIAVLGGGIAGLAAAFHLGRRHEVTLFEARDRLGGNIRTEEVEGCRVEWGPNGWLDNEPGTREFVRALGLESRLVRARECAALRFVWRAGRLRALPARPQQFLFSDCLPLASRLRVLCEPFAAKPPDGDESIHDFAARRIGRGAADILVDAFVTGIYAGDPRRLSVRSALPRLKQLENEYGSLIRGAKGRGFGPPGTLTSFDEGLEVLVKALAERIDVRFESPWKTLDQDGFDRVVCTVPAPRAAELAGGVLGEHLRRIPTAPVAVVATVFPDPLDVPDAFGFLVPRGQGLRILGTLYDSSIFVGRAPKGLRLFRTMVGGRRDAAALDLDDGALLEIVARDLRRVWGFTPEPCAVAVIRHPLGIAQYERGHADLLRQIAEACPPWLRLAGSSYRGVSLNLCIKEALDWSP